MPCIDCTGFCTALGVAHVGSACGIMRFGNRVESLPIRSRLETLFLALLCEGGAPLFLNLQRCVKRSPASCLHALARRSLPCSHSASSAAAWPRLVITRAGRVGRLGRDPPFSPVHEHWPNPFPFHPLARARRVRHERGISIRFLAPGGCEGDGYLDLFLSPPRAPQQALALRGSGDL